MSYKNPYKTTERKIKLYTGIEGTKLFNDLLEIDLIKLRHEFHDDWKIIHRIIDNYCE